jgi:hypothetical protein
MKLSFENAQQQSIDMQRKVRIGEADNYGDANKQIDKEICSDLEREEVVEEIMLHGSKEDLEEFRRFHSFTKEKVEMLQYFFKLRNDVLTQMHKDFVKRITANPEPTEDEWKMGTYEEDIEYQVRDAIKILRKKGYNTFESGFYGPEMQRIGFSDKKYEYLTPSNRLIDLAKEKGMDIIVQSDGIELKYNKIVSLADIKYLWDQIAMEVKDLGYEAESSQITAAKTFAERVENIKRNPEKFL